MDEEFFTGPLQNLDPEDEDYIEEDENLLLTNLTRETVDKFFAHKERKFIRRAKEFYRLELEHCIVDLQSKYSIAPLSLRNHVADRMVKEGLLVADAEKLLSTLLQEKLYQAESDTRLQYCWKVQFYGIGPKTWCLQWATKSMATRVTLLEILQDLAKGTEKQEVIDYFFSEYATFEPRFIEGKGFILGERHGKRRLKAMKSFYKTVFRYQRGTNDPELCGQLKRLAEELKVKISESQKKHETDYPPKMDA